MNFRKLNLLLCAMLIVVYSLAGCSLTKKTQGRENDFPVTICGVTIASEPKRVVVLSDSIADIIIGMKETSKICGKSDECTQDSLSHIQSVGSEIDPSVDEIKTLNADLVLYDKDLSQGKINALNGINLVKIKKASSRSELETLYNNVAKVLKGEVSGADVASTFSKGVLYSFDEILRIIPEQTVSPTLCYLFDETGKTVTEDDFASKIIEAVGAMNVAADIKDGVILASELRLANPTYIFCDKGVKEKILSNPDYQELEAVKKERVFELDSTLIRRQGESLVEAAKIFAASIYPELLEDSSPSTTRKAATGTTTTAEPTKSKDVPTEKTSENVTTKTVKQEEVPAVDDIMKIQERLDELYYLHTVPNGIMDDKMRQAIKDFKYLNGMEVTDSIDQDFLNALFSSSAVVRPDPARPK